MIEYYCQGDRDAGRPSYGLSAVCAKATKKNKKKYRKPLDKPNTMWYNKSVKRGTSAAKAPRTVDTRNKSELPTNSHEIYLF